MFVNPSFIYIYLLIYTMPAVRWLLILFSDVEHFNVFKVLWFSTISEVASVLDMTPQVVSNWRHGQILDRGPLRYCDIHRVDRVQD